MLPVKFAQKPTLSKYYAYAWACAATLSLQVYRSAVVGQKLYNKRTQKPPDDTDARTKTARYTCIASFILQVRGMLGFHLHSSCKAAPPNSNKAPGSPNPCTHIAYYMLFIRERHAAWWRKIFTVRPYCTVLEHRLTKQSHPDAITAAGR